MAKRCCCLNKIAYKSTSAIKGVKLFISPTFCENDDCVRNQRTRWISWKNGGIKLLHFFLRGKSRLLQFIIITLLLSHMI